MQTSTESSHWIYSCASDRKRLSFTSVVGFFVSVGVVIIIRVLRVIDEDRKSTIRRDRIVSEQRLQKTQVSDG